MVISMFSTARTLSLLRISIFSAFGRTANAISSLFSLPLYLIAMELLTIAGPPLTDPCARPFWDAPVVSLHTAVTTR